MAAFKLPIRLPKAADKDATQMKGYASGVVRVTKTSLSGGYHDKAYPKNYQFNCSLYITVICMWRELVLAS
jgi:hypothetical protein